MCVHIIFIYSHVNDMDEEYYNNIRTADEYKKEECSPCKMDDTDDRLNESGSTSEFDSNSEDETEEEDENLNTNIKWLINKIRIIIRIVRGSPKMFEILKEYIEKDNLPPLSLKIDCVTRWSSLYGSLDRFEKYNLTINKFLKGINKQELRLSYSKLGALKEIIGVLKIFNNGFLLLSREDMNLFNAEVVLKG